MPSIVFKQAVQLVRTNSRVACLLISFLLWAPLASPQIISTSLPSLNPVAGKAPVSAHFMLSPVGSWDYNEVWFSDQPFPGYDEYFVGSVGKASTSQILAAAEAAIPLGTSGWTATVGGWYNKIGDVDYEFDGQYLNISNAGSGFLDFVVPSTATIPISVTILEGHAGLFRGPFGAQIRFVRSTLESDGDILSIDRSDGAPQPDLPGYAGFDTSTTDMTFYGVYKRAFSRLSASAGAGIYRKAGIGSADDSPLRFADSTIVPSGFLTATYEVRNRITLDASYWFIGETDQAQDIEGYSSTTPSDTQSRFTVGVGFSY
jgi:hypothetical protein